MRLSDFDYDLPKELIARYPATKRTGSRLLCLDGNSGDIQHKNFVDLPEFLQKGDLLIFNNSRVIPARAFGHKESGGRIEILIERILDDHSALAHIKASRAPQVGSFLKLELTVDVEIIARHNDLFELKFHDERPIYEILNRIGHLPLPPYLERPSEDVDKERYQTVYAEPDGSVAAPTAGLHFDEAFMQKLSDQGVEFAFVTLHVGAGTFQPVRTDVIKDHEMHHEYIEVPQSVCDKINAAKARGNRVVAVGTTTARSLETAAQGGELEPFFGDTNIYIYPGFQFNCIDALITNFHLPESTLLMLVCAFSGYEPVLRAYKEAVDQRYRFFSYGDAMFLTRKE